MGPTGNAESDKRTELNLDPYTLPVPETTPATLPSSRSEFSTPTGYGPALRRLYVVVFIRLGSRRIEHVAVTRHPDGRWVTLQARNLLMERLLIFNRRQLERVLGVFVRHNNGHRPHRALALQSTDMTATPSTRADPPAPAISIQRRDLLGGLIHEYDTLAA